MDLFESMSSADACNAVMEDGNPASYFMRILKEDCSNKTDFESATKHVTWKSDLLNTCNAPLSECDLQRHSFSTNERKGSAHQQTRMSLRSKPRSKAHLTHLSNILDDLNQHPQLGAELKLSPKQHLKNEIAPAHNVKKENETNNIDNGELHMKNKDFIEPKDESDESKNEKSKIFKTRSFSMCPPRRVKNNFSHPQHAIKKEENSRNTINNKLRINGNDRILNKTSNVVASQEKHLNSSKCNLPRAKKVNKHKKENSIDTEQIIHQLAKDQSRESDLTNWFKWDTIHRSTAKRLGQLMSYTPEQAKFISSYTSVVNKTGSLLEAASNQQKTYKPEDASYIGNIDVRKSNSDSSSISHSVGVANFPVAQLVSNNVTKVSGSPYGTYERKEIDTDDVPYFQKPKPIKENVDNGTDDFSITKLVSNSVSKLFGSPHGIYESKGNESNGFSYFGKFNPSKENSSSTQNLPKLDNASVYHLNGSSHTGQDYEYHQKRKSTKLNGKNGVKKPYRLSSSVADTQLFEVNEQVPNTPSTGAELSKEQYRMIERVSRDHQTRRYNPFRPDVSTPPPVPRPLRPAFRGGRGGLSRVFNAPDRFYDASNENTYTTLSDDKAHKHQSLMFSSEKSDVYTLDNTIKQSTFSKVSESLNNVIVTNNRQKYEALLESDRYNKNWDKIREDLKQRKALNHSAANASRVSGIHFEQPEIEKSTYYSPRVTNSNPMVMKTNKPMAGRTGRNNNRYVKKQPPNHLSPVFTAAPRETNRRSLEISNSEYGRFMKRNTKKMPSGEYEFLDHKTVQSASTLNLRLNLDRKSPVQKNKKRPKIMKIEEPKVPKKYARKMPSGEYEYVEERSNRAPIFNLKFNFDRKIPGEDDAEEYHDPSETDEPDLSGTIWNKKRYAKEMPNGEYVYVEQGPPIQPARSLNPKIHDEKEPTSPSTVLPRMPSHPTALRMKNWENWKTIDIGFSSKKDKTQMTKSVSEDAIMRVNYPKTYKVRKMSSSSEKSTYPVLSPSMPDAYVY